MTSVENYNSVELPLTLELRRQRIEQERRAKRRVSAIVMIGISVNAPLLDRTDNLSYRVHKNGDVSYLDAFGKELLRDTSDAIWIYDESDDSVELAILLAQKRFGNGGFGLEGGAAFVEQVIRVAAERNMAVRFADDAINERIEKLKKQLHPQPTKRVPDYKVLQDQAGGKGKAPKPK